MKVKDLIKKIRQHYILSNIIGVVLVFLLLLTGFMFGLDVYTHHGEEIEIPDLKNKPLDVAEMELEQLDLKISVSDTGYVKKLAPGSILDQIPEAGTMAKAGHTIYVIINSSTSPNIKIPDIIDNSSLREAEAKLRALGFRIEPARLIEGEKDWVYGLEDLSGREINAGEKIPVGKVLRVVVGDGSSSNEDVVDSTMMIEDDMEFEEVQEGGGDVDEFEEVL